MTASVVGRRSLDGGADGGDGVGLDGDGAELRAGWAGGAQEDFHARGRARMTAAGVTRITVAVSRVRTAEAEQGVDAYNKDI